MKYIILYFHGLPSNTEGLVKDFCIMAKLKGYWQSTLRTHNFCNYYSALKGFRTLILNLSTDAINRIRLN